jgi:hypothetical protein
VLGKEYKGDYDPNVIEVEEVEEVVINAEQNQEGESNE